MTDIKPIETHYKGYRFRSRLEARWAVFFDIMGYDWQYEPEGFELPIYGKYLPDFYLPHVDTYCEVKPTPESFDPPMKYCIMVDKTRSKFICLCGVPDIVYYLGFEWDELGNPEGILRGHNNVSHTYYWIGDYHDYYLDEHRFYSSPANSPNDEGVITDRYIKAVNAARSARFEHGECG